MAIVCAYCNYVLCVYTAATTTYACTPSSITDMVQELWEQRLLSCISFFITTFQVFVRQNVLAFSMNIMVWCIMLHSIRKTCACSILFPFAVSNFQIVQFTYARLQSPSFFLSPTNMINRFITRALASPSGSGAVW